ncbi:hypothetical protein MHPYR_70114 [uncultured Mycobacterium sp.]|uniref:Uncharacterized protein n=1 Tax=uncultured Mycobacterium sp. TaxID=171292 RepID=A0A1Y5PKJ9_9MYCO|nr:hypothetical protein MHPYR_70114 [uncultured Mycobacterium sp.]
MSPARPTERAVEPAPLANISQVARAARPLAAAAVATGEELRFLAGLRRAAGFADRDAPVDLVVRALERAAVLFAMRASLVAVTPSAPPTTPVTRRVVARLRQRPTEAVYGALEPPTETPSCGDTKQG